MFDRSLTFLSFGRMIGGGGSHRTSSSTFEFWGPGAWSQAEGRVLQAPTFDFTGHNVAKTRILSKWLTNLTHLCCVLSLF